MRKLVGLGLCLVVAATLGGCSSLNAADAKDVKAILNYKDMTVQQPLDKYALSARENILIQHANVITFDACLQKYGFSDPAIDRDWASLPVIADRVFGIWSLEYAEKHGYSMPVRPDESAIEAQFDTPIPARDDAWTKCFSEVQFMDIFPTRAMNLQKPTVLDEGYFQTGQAAMGDATVKTLIESWKDCVEEQGVETNPNADGLPVYPEDDIAGQMPIALIDIKCKEDLQFRQKMADIEAQYQGSYILKHEADLKAHREKATETLEKARKIVDERG